MATGERLKERKISHIDICRDWRNRRIESKGRSFFDDVSFFHRALPEIDAGRTDTSYRFLGYNLKVPFLISCMTGGSDEGFRINRDLAAAAEACGVAVGTGSIRILFHNEELFDHFHLKPLARNVPVLANVSAVQLREIGPAGMMRMLDRLEADAVAVHLNPAQELFQPEGDRDFRTLYDSIGSFRDRAAIPVIVKETGCGILPGDVRRLLSLGVDFVDVAGAGGTNWVLVESHRLEGTEGEAASLFGDWGTPTPFLLRMFRGKGLPLIASGGIRNAMDGAKALALGGMVAGMALPVIKAYTGNGKEGVIDLVRQFEKVLRTVLVLTGTGTIEKLRSVPLWYKSRFEREYGSFLASLKDPPNE